MAEKGREPTFEYVEDESTEKIKRWWKTNGTAVIIGILLGVGSMVGYQLWGLYQARQHEAASDIYQAMLRQLGDGQMSGVRQSADSLVSKYVSTTYADAASLMLAKLEVEGGSPELADSHLERVIEDSNDSVMGHIARLRLASLALDRGDLDRADQFSSVEETEGFESQYLEIQGDVLMARGDIPRARDIYQEALATAVVGSDGYRMLNRKLNNTKRVGNDQ